MNKSCVKCGYIRLATDSAPIYECPKCGVVYEKAETALASRHRSIQHGVDKKSASAVEPANRLRFVLVSLSSIFVLFGGGYELTKYVKKIQAEKEKAARLVGIEKLSASERRWADGIKLASSTGRIALSGPVQNLQTIAREIQAIEVSECLKPAKAKFIEGADLSIEGFMLFMQQSEFDSKIKMMNAEIKTIEYRTARDKCK